MIIPTDLSLLSTTQKNWLLENYLSYVNSGSAIIYVNQNWGAQGNHLLILCKNTTYSGGTYTFNNMLFVHQDGSTHTLSSDTDSLGNTRYVYSLRGINGVNNVEITETSGGEIVYPPTENIILEDNPLSFNITDSLEFVANYDVAKYNVTTSVNPTGAGTTSGDGEYQVGASVTISATAGEHKIFTNWTQNGTIVSTNPTYTFTMGMADVEYVANFVDQQQYTINAQTMPNGIGSVRLSAKSVWQGESVTLTARDEKGYLFSHWSNNQTTNPITITPTGNINITAYYEKVAENTDTYDYRCFVKDQLALNTTPKAFMLVRSFKIRRDLLTTANSEIEVAEIPSNLNNGDVLCLYKPNGTIIYYGIVTSFSDTKIKCSQIQSFYKGNWVYETHSTTSLEAEIQYLLTKYSNGQMKNSTYTDSLVAQEKQPISVLVNSTTQMELEEKDANFVMDMEEFIYSLYEKYGLVFDFTIPYGSWSIGDTTKGSVTIRKPNTTEIKVGNNAESILDLSPITEVETTNRLIVYASDGTYRKTYVATSTNGVVEEPATIVGRFGQIETKIVFSDDELVNIKNANINANLYNHKVEFTLMLDNNLYDFWSWELGQPIAIYNDNEYFNSVFTGYEISKSENAEITEVKVICGKVRTALTKMLTRGVV